LSFETKSVKSKQFSDTSKIFSKIKDPEDLENFQEPHTEDTAKEKDFK
jgi:hypothetical protein